MSDITIKPTFISTREEFEEYIEDIEINFKTNKGSFIGTFNSWNVIINLNSNIEIPEDIKFNFFLDEKKHITPTFKLLPAVNDETKQELQVKGYDNSNLFDTPFEWTETLPCNAGKIALGICNKVGVKLKNTNFINSDFIVYRQMVDSKRTNREVIAMIAAIAVGNAFINENDELEIRSFLDTDIEIQEYFSSEEFIKVGPITGVNLAREPIKQYEEKNDDYLASKNKKLVVKITNNLIIDDNRELALPAIYDKLHGLEFYCKKIETYEAYFIRPFSFVNSNNNKVLVDTICLKYPSLLDSYISSNNLDEISSNSKNKSLRQRIINAEAKVDEVEGKIKLLTEEVTDYENKMTEIEQTVESITDKVFNEIDITREVQGNKLILENCMQGYLLELYIYGNNTVFKYLLPSDNLFPADDLLPYGDSRIKVTRQVKDEEGNITEVSEIIDLGIKEVLRQKDEVCDEYVLSKNKAKIIRRIGVLETGETYILPQEKIEDLGECIIELSKDINMIEIKNYIANMKARYVILNDFTKEFATSVQVESIIRQTTQEILMQLSKKVGDEEIIAKFNMAIKDKQSIIELIGDIVKIKSKYFELTEEGQITALKGIIAGLIMSTNDNGDSYLYKNYKVGNKTYQSGLFIPKESSGAEAFIYAGVDITNGAGYLKDANTILQHNGLLKAKWFSVNGESGNFFVDFDSGNRALDFSKDHIDWRLDNEANNRWFSIFKATNGQWFSLFDAPLLGIMDGVHTKNLMTIYRDSDANQARVSINTNTFVNGQQVGATATSDKRLKKYIKECTKSGLEKIRQFKIKSFKWRKSKNPLDYSEDIVDFGIIAQEAKEVDSNCAVHNKKYDTWQMNELDLICTCIKAIQELDKENHNLKCKVNKLTEDLKKGAKI